MDTVVGNIGVRKRQSCIVQRVFFCVLLVSTCTPFSATLFSAEKESGAPSTTTIVPIASGSVNSTSTAPATPVPIPYPSISTTKLPADAAAKTAPQPAVPIRVTPVEVAPSNVSAEKSATDNAGAIQQSPKPVAPVQVLPQVQKTNQVPSLTHLPPRGIDPIDPNQSSAKVAELNAQPPKLARVLPGQCFNPGQQIAITGSFHKDHQGLLVAIDGQGGHFHLTTTNFSEAQITALWPTSFPNEILGPYLLRMEPPGAHAALGNIVTDLWRCASTPQLAEKNPTQVKVVPEQRQEQPIEQTPSRTNPTPSVEARQETRTDNGAPRAEVNAPATNQAPPPSNGSLIGGSFPAPPQVAAATADDADGDDIEAEQVVIITATMAEAATLTDALAEYGGRIKTRQNLENLGMVLNVFRLPAGQSVNELLPILRQRFTNLWIDTNQRLELMGGDKKRYGQEALQWDAEQAQCLKPVKIGIVDTQIDLTHPALQGVPITTKSFLESGSVPAAADHGTAVATLLVGSAAVPSYIGLLPNATIFSANIFRQRSNEKETTVEWLVLALDWLMGQQVHIINLSLGGERNLILELTLRKVLEKNIVVVAAAGNNGAGSPPVFPAAQEGVVAVTAIDAKQKLYRKATTGQYIDIAAPGVDVWVADERGKGRYQSGTSYAAPLAAASIAARLVLDDAHSSQTVLANLANFAVDLGTPGRDPEYGWGLIQWPSDCK